MVAVVALTPLTAARYASAGVKSFEEAPPRELFLVSLPNRVNRAGVRVGAGAGKGRVVGREIGKGEGAGAVVGGEEREEEGGGGGRARGGEKPRGCWVMEKLTASGLVEGGR